MTENEQSSLPALNIILTPPTVLICLSAFSTLPTMIVDSALFVTFAFYGTIPILPIITGLIVVKWLVGIIDIPFMYLSRYIMYR